MYICVCVRVHMHVHACVYMHRDVYCLWACSMYM